MNRLYLFACFLLLTVGANASEMDNIGSVDFPTSTDSPEAQQHFQRGVGFLHSFGWKQARTEFQAAQALDPGFAMAHWGEAMTYNHPLISEWDTETPKQVLGKLGDTREERLAAAPTDREKGFMLAVDELFFSEGDTMTRRTAQMQAMRALYQRYPGDDEVAAYYALSLLSAAGPAGSGHRLNVLAGSIAMDLSRRNPDHPGAVHYTIHAFDDPVHAPLALPAAYVFAEIAEAVSHARHMPTHIFIQLGMWQRVSDSNQSAYEAAVALWEPGDMALDMTHALDWGQYGDLQLGDYERAELWIERMEEIASNNQGQDRVIEALPRVNARLILESEQWATRPVTDGSQGTELLATGISAVHLGEIELAREAAAALKTRADMMAGGDSSYYARTAQPMQIMHREVAGLIAIAQGDQDQGFNLMQEGVAIAESMRPPNGAANPLKPVHELYGQVLLDAGEVDQAADLFSRSLLRTPNRPLSLLGLARSYAALGDESGAREQYQKLAEVWKGRDFPGLEEANRYIAAND